MLKEDDTLATEATGEEDQDGTGLEAVPDLSGTKGLAGLYAIENIHVRIAVSNMSKIVSHSHFQFQFHSHAESM